MFGGYGLYNDGLFFAIIADDTLFFKVDDHTRHIYEEYEMEPFTYEKQGKDYSLGYYEVPIDILESPPQLQAFVDAACAVAQRAKKKKK
jgi:DNA transformation protein